MSENELTLFDKLFGDSQHFVYLVGSDGRPDYGYIEVGQREYKIINVKVWDIGGRPTEQLELENKQFLRGRERIS